MSIAACSVCWHRCMMASQKLEGEEMRWEQKGVGVNVV